MEQQSTTGILEEFQSEFLVYWQKLPNKAFFFALLLVWLALFQFLGNSTFGYINTPSLFRWMFGVYTAHDSSGEISEDCVGLLMVPLVLGLLWVKRRELMALPVRVWWPGLLLMLAGMLLHLAAYLVQVPQASIAAMLLGILGAIALAWGPRWLAGTLFPCFLLVFCIPFSKQLDFLTTRLQLLVCWIVAGICHTGLGIDVIREGAILKDPGGQYQYEVIAACAGIRSLIIIGLMATVLAFLTFGSWWRRLALIAAAVPLAVISNVVRLLCVVIAASIGGQETGNYVHEGGPGGLISLLPYIIAFAGLYFLGNWLEKPKLADSEAVPA